MYEAFGYTAEEEDSASTAVSGGAPTSDSSASNLLTGAIGGATSGADKSAAGFRAR